MFILKVLVIGLQLLAGLAPAAITLWAVRISEPLAALAALAGIYVVVAIFPLYRKRESIWVFLFSFLATIPLNFTLCRDLLAELYQGAPVVLNLLRGFFLYALLLSIQELLFCLFARLFWPKQYKTLLAKL